MRSTIRSKSNFNISIDADVLRKLDTARTTPQGVIPRSTFIEHLIRVALEGGRS